MYGLVMSLTGFTATAAAELTARFAMDGSEKWTYLPDSPDSYRALS